MKVFDIQKLEAICRDPCSDPECKLEYHSKVMLNTDCCNQDGVLVVYEGGAGTIGLHCAVCGEMFARIEVAGTLLPVRN